MPFLAIISNRSKTGSEGLFYYSEGSIACKLTSCRTEVTSKIESSFFRKNIQYTYFSSKVGFLIVSTQIWTFRKWVYLHGVSTYTKKVLISINQELPTELMAYRSGFSQFRVSPSEIDKEQTHTETTHCQVLSHTVYLPFLYHFRTVIFRNETPYMCRNKALSERPLPSREKFRLCVAFKTTFGHFSR